MKKIISIFLIFIMILSIASCDFLPGQDVGDGFDNDDNNGLGDIDGNEGSNPNPDFNLDPTPDPDPIPTPDLDPEVMTAFLLNRAGWTEVSVYYWNMENHTEINGGWPGEKIELGTDGLYRADTTYEHTHLIFNNNNNGAQTADLNRPTGEKIVYDNVDNCWITYAEAIRFLTGGSESPNPDPTPDPNPDPTPDPDPDPTPTPDPTPDPTPTPDYPADDIAAFNDLFDPNNHISFKLDISASELKKIQQDYDYYASKGSKSPIYRMADLIVTITKPDGTVMKWTIDQVGVRMKGNTSRTSFYNDWDGMYNLIHFKISFQETFDEVEYYGSDAINWTDSAARKARKDRTFATLEKIDIRWNRNFDATCIRESYAYDLYRENGVLAPHTNLASVDIGNDHAGVWVIYEPIDKIFLEKNLPESALGGDLYKLGWTNEGATFTSFSSYGVEDEDAGKFFVYDLKTNKKTSTHQSLKNLINTLNSGSLTKEQFASVVDVDNFMKYCAVSYMVGNCDDLRYNYNNSYIYFRADTGKMLVIPYDMDRGLGVNRWNPSGHGMTREDPFTNWTASGNQRSPLFLKSVCNGGFFKNEYIEALKVVDAHEMLTNEKFVERFNIAKNLYSDDVVPSKSYSNAEQSRFYFDVEKSCGADESRNMSFLDYITAKRSTLYSYIGNLGNGGSSGDNNDNPGSDTGNEGDNTGGNTGNTGTKSSFYIRADFNGWANDENCRMTHNGDGTYTITFTRDGSFKFKVYNDNNGAWYGGEVLDEAALDPNGTVKADINNSRKNIVLSAGTYTVIYDSNTNIIYIS
ncbi:MAG: CotH kinase family protein [Clostridia bacterium]|nr:CotH kinase family protein [Clostridia bacterium]